MPFLETLFWVLLAGAVAAIVISWESITAWFNENKTTDTSYGELLKQSLASGKYKVIANVFNKTGNQTATKTWEDVEISDDLQKKFGNLSQLVIEV